MDVVQNGRLVDSDCREFVGEIKLAVYYASDGCTPCRVGHLTDIAELFDIDSVKRFTPVVIFTPREEQYQGLLNLLRQTPFQFPVFIDRSRGFLQNNDCIPTDPRFHTFLLDKNNRVVLVGNPLAGETMWNLFKSTLDNLLAHDGIYVPDIKY